MELVKLLKIVKRVSLKNHVVFLSHGYTVALNDVGGNIHDLQFAPNGMYSCSQLSTAWVRYQQCFNSQLHCHWNVLPDMWCRRPGSGTLLQLVHLSVALSDKSLHGG